MQVSSMQKWTTTRKTGIQATDVALTISWRSSLCLFTSPLDSLQEWRSLQNLPVKTRRDKRLDRFTSVMVSSHWFPGTTSFSYFTCNPFSGSFLFLKSVNMSIMGIVWQSISTFSSWWSSRKKRTASRMRMEDGPFASIWCTLIRHWTRNRAVLNLCLQQILPFRIAWNGIDRLTAELDQSRETRISEQVLEDLVADHIVAITQSPIDGKWGYTYRKTT